ncbi:membrane-associated tyrosine- and threonine-specific cdc2-inhibitory kinase [Nelusetta ayraudi]|uniref:membrane-associated tyrosine- and threonine-specific cdc2-inhibitory kinase n=1 Tax=Nelusetta ayraudi TaxID=303726 RepID=UPI003F730A23
MSVAVETTTARVAPPLPAHFSHAEQCFSIKKRRVRVSSSSTSDSSFSSPSRHSLAPLKPSKGCPSVCRLFPQQPSPWTPLSCSLTKSPLPTTEYDPNKQQSYFNQCFSNLGLIGRGSFGEVYKVQSNKDGCQYAVKRSAYRFRGKSERNRSVREARNHERLCPHPHILNLVAAWEECGRLYIQTELCSTTLLLHAETQSPRPDEPAAWAYMCDLLSALQHLHSHGFVHLDLKPANVLMTASGRLKLGDFGLLLELRNKGRFTSEDDVQEGDPRYMAPELLRGEYGPAADVFSLGVTILEVACNIEVPNGGNGWQQLRQGCLPSEFTSSLSSDLQTVLRMMLAPEPSDRPTVSELLALPAVWKERWKRRMFLIVAEMAMTLTSFCQMVVCFGCRLWSSLRWPFVPHWTKAAPSTPPKNSWEKEFTLPLSAMHGDSGSPEDEAVTCWTPSDSELSPTFSHRVKSRLSMDNTSTPLPGSPTHNHHSPARTKPSDWATSCSKMTTSSIHSNRSYHTLTPSSSPVLAELQTNIMNETSAHNRHPSSVKSSQRHRQNRTCTEEALPRPSFEPKNLLSLFEEPD